MMTKQTLIFDMDGTLFKTDTVLLSALDKTFDCLRSVDEWEGGTPIEKYLDIMGVPLPEVWRNLLPMHEEALHEKVNRMFHVHLFQEIRNGSGELYPGILELLEEQSKEYRIFIASNGLNSYLLEIVNCFTLDSLLSGVYSIERCPSGRKEDLVKIILEENEISSAIMVGDRSSDIKAGKENGLYTVGCAWGFASEGELDEADIIINSTSELESVLRKQRVQP
ncbi:HAD hydrolase-like protein [Rossellomorea vietnamensis]|nr:HAD hydrolase-like protein [Rossellomorea vietnamensis]